MMEARQIEALLQQANRARRAHDWNTAVGLMKRALAIDPEHAICHATLALSLLGARRLHGAAVEVDLALAFDANDPFCHYAAAAVRAAERKLTDAWQHALVALHDDQVDADTHVLAAEIKKLQGDRAAARSQLEEALALDADHVGALSALASLDLWEGRVEEAHRRIEIALVADPSDVDAHIVAGYVALRRGDSGQAEQHARFALGENAADHSALQLWTAVKAHNSFLLGLWWRWNAFVGMRSERLQVGLMLGAFVVVRVAIIVLGAAGYEDVEILLGRLWLGFCAYTWFAPRIFRWMLERELHSVVLRDDY